MILSKKLKDSIIDKIISVCNDEIYGYADKELLGLTINYFYDGEATDIGCVVHVFNNDPEVDEGYTKNISFILDCEKSELLEQLEKYPKEKKFMFIKQAASEIKTYIEGIKWRTKTKTYEEMFIDLEEYD